MGDRSSIEWTDATWNPVTGCSHVSEGCRHCYAETFSLRFGRSKKPWTAQNAAENVVLHPERLDMPLRWTRPRMVFVNSMSDLFHELVPMSFIRQVFDVMVRARQHTFQVLTKRPERMRNLLPDLGPFGGSNSWRIPNVWLGTSIEEDRWCSRADELRQTPATVRFLSCEPLLGPLPSLNLDGIGWVIVGGESGHGARPMHPAWARDIRDRCVAAGVPFFFKQWGEWRTQPEVGEDPATFYGQRAGKKAAGRELDGRTWDQMPGRA